MLIPAFLKKNVYLCNEIIQNKMAVKTAKQDLTLKAFPEEINRRWGKDLRGDIL